MSNEIYYQLREQLDQYSVGFPATKSGVELKILKKLFTEEEAHMYLNLSMMLETPESVAERMKQDPEKAANLLENMAEKGLIFRLRKEDSSQYAATPFVIGFYEFQVKTMDRELDQCEEAGLVPQPVNSQNAGAICNCCGDCCGMLRALKKNPRPAEIVISNYYALVDSDLCAACETCLDRCQMEAITIGPEEVAEVNFDRCIGCGLCVTTCTTEALSLQPKPEEERREPPEKPRDTMMQIAQQRGKSLIPLAFTKTSQSGS